MRVRRNATHESRFLFVLEGRQRHAQSPASILQTIQERNDYCRILARSLVMVVLCLPALQGVTAPNVASNCADIQILSDQLAPREAEAYCLYAVSERQKVEGYWGATWKEPIRIHVDSSYRISKALIPGYRGNRGFMEMPLRGVRNNDGALLHEIVHIYAPNDNRFLAEGLAVYLHQKLAGNRAFPNFGRTLDAEARGRLPELESLDRLNGVRTPTPLGAVLREQSAYIVAGSFVGFLIDKYGLSEFRKLYETGAYEAIYGKPLEALEKEWRMAL